MAAPTVTFWANVSTNDYNPNSSDPSLQNRCTGVETLSWKQITLAQTTLVFTGVGVQSGEPSGTRDPIIIPASGSVESPKTFLDVSATVGGGMYQVPLAGTTAGRQNGGGHIAVFAVYFSGATAGPPFLEYWDTDTLTTTQYQCLGGGTPNNSYIWGHACQETNTVPQTYPDNWTGTPLAGGGANRLKLYPTAIPTVQGGGSACYYNLKVVIPYTAQPFNESPVCVLRYTYN
jgi:hypothetical protein